MPQKRALERPTWKAKLGGKFLQVLHQNFGYLLRPDECHFVEHRS